jgi:hypothetical protein
MSWITKQLERVATDVNNIIRDPIGEIKRGPRGTLGDILGTEDDDDDDGASATPTLDAGEVDPEANMGALQDIRKKKYGRTAHNLAPASGSSILTS